MELPVTDIVQLCQKYNTISVIEGGHCPGQFPLDFDKIEADFFTGNFHKWMFAPWGCAFVWKNKKVTFPLRSLMSSSPAYDLVSQFCFQGTKDYSCYSSLPVAVEYFKSKGEIERISGYNTRFIQLASDYLISLWNTGKLEIPESMEPPYLRMIRLPEINGFGTSKEDANSLMDIIFLNYHIDACLKSVQNELYARLSAQIYNCLDDYKIFGEAILLLMKTNSRLS
ncbi:putative L-cysteine desulfhydrase 2 [Pecten maximus]|uniref:putative L-cysteine desulfhydrase 2 n=1 Tax=Pecten maximus TaxID=6579 RepID=UPI0014580E1A|nr:putative L-cysteine desulfhydrase 2 [Pecten maximus]